MEVTLEITNFCDHGCDYCSSNAHINGSHLSLDAISNFLKGIEGITRINISGGEPLAHPNFYVILKLCKLYTDNVKVYTNALEHIIFNSDIIKRVIVEANVCIIPGREVYIPDNVDRIHLLKLVRQGRAKDFKEVPIVVSRNFRKSSPKGCEDCKHILLQADGQIVESPCKKKYGEECWKK